MTALPCRAPGKCSPAGKHGVDHGFVRPGPLSRHPVADRRQVRSALRAIEQGSDGLRLHLAVSRIEPVLVPIETRPSWRPRSAYGCNAPYTSTVAPIVVKSKE